MKKVVWTIAFDIFEGDEENPSTDGCFINPGQLGDELRKKLEERIHELVEKGEYEA